MALTDNLTHYWKFDEASGNAADTVGSLTLTNNGTATFGAALINNGATLARASSQYFNTTTDVHGGALSAYSIQVWYKPTTAPTGADEHYIQSMNDAPGYSNILYNINAGNLRVRFRQLDNVGAGVDISYTVTLSTSAYHHLVGTWNGTQTEFFVDGVSRGTASISTIETSGSQGFAFGATAGGTDYVNGNIDEIGFWTRALSGTEVTELYNGGMGLAYPFSVAATPRTRTLMGVGS